LKKGQKEKNKVIREKTKDMGEPPRPFLDEKKGDGVSEEEKSYL